MLDPPGDLSDLVVMADWVELSVATSVPPEADRMSVGETLDAAGLMGMQDGGLPPGDVNWMDEDVLTPDDESDRYTELLWEELHRRAAEFGPDYPFYVDAEALALKAVNWREIPAYMFLLLLDHGRRYPQIHVDLVPNSAQARLFEKVVEAASLSLFRGKSQRFGWPREPGWPTAMRDRLGQLAEILEISVEENLGGKLTEDEKDKGLDVVASLGLGIHPDATIWFLFQCACGANWKDKIGEPSLVDWRDLLVWRGQLVRGLALPWRLREPWDINRTGRKFDAVVLEKDRLLHGHPDLNIDLESRQMIIDWCEPVVDGLPYLATA